MVTKPCAKHAPVVEDVVAELMRDLPEAVRENDIEDGVEISVLLCEAETVLLLDEIPF
jgi:hypothetical protein